MADFDVIFIDDEVSLTEIFQHYVVANYKNWRFLTYSNSVLAHNEIANKKISAKVWIIDMMMPGKNGAEIAETVRSKYGHSPVILAYTALDRQELYTHESYRDRMLYFNQVISKREDLQSMLSLVNEIYVNK